MPIFHAIGQELISRSEYLARAAEMQQSAAFDVGLAEPAGSVRPFADIDFGRPLNIVMRKVYTGKFPQKKVFSSSKPMLITSAIKDITTTSAAAQAIHVLKQDVSAHSTFNGPGAREEGTQLVYYSPAVASSLITISIQMVFDDFDDELFTQASQLFTNLAGVPIFVPASGYLLGASTVLKLAGDLGGALFRNKAVLDESMELDFTFGGGAIPKPGYWVISPGSLDLSKFQYDPNRGLVEKSSGQTYSGDDPVIVLSIDGSEQPSLTNFSPLMASASVLGQFFNQKPGSEVVMDTVLSAVKLYNDFTFRKKAEELEQRLKAAPTGSDEQKLLQKQVAALNGSITEPRLKLSQAQGV